MGTRRNTEKPLLTAREQQILELMSYGLSQKEVADKLGISPNTVDVHLKNIKEKTGLQKNTELECAFFYKKYKLPMIDLPMYIKERIATALLALSVFTAIIHTTDMVRVFRTARPGQRTVRGGSRRSRSEYDCDYYLMSA